MMLATVSPKGQPSSRVVLLKDINASGFTFFTHYKSRKGLELEANPQVSFVMFWPAFDRQLVVMGRTEKTTADVSRNYFASRPRGSQISALASPQSEPTDRAWLEQQVGTLTKRYPEGSAVPVPENWGGYLVRPTEIQFWHGRPNRLHDRFRYLKQADGDWQRQRLAP
jgi:pyridoxamine 5'-phosphate oxidase